MARLAGSKRVGWLNAELSNMHCSFIFAPTPLGPLEALDKR